MALRALLRRELRRCSWLRPLWVRMRIVAALTLGLSKGSSRLHRRRTLTTVFRTRPQETISDNCVVIFSKTTCSYCNMAKKLFHDANINYTAIELDRKENGSQFQDVLHQMTGGRTVPRIFINGTFVGGATDTQRLHQEGRLLPLVHQCQIQRDGRSRQTCSLP
nr:PREDICTED: glutaredoxin 2 [Anolis carolinensis]|eukprot:XP_016851433.1 PREDICTED: glutaredoxin 2 [Anolis carolinensis]